jgi:hypothetical protein
VLRTGDEHPDWEKLGADHYIANWERRFWKLLAGKKEADARSVEADSFSRYYPFRYVSAEISALARAPPETTKEVKQQRIVGNERPS